MLRFSNEIQFALHPCVLRVDGFVVLLLFCFSDDIFSNFQVYVVAIQTDIMKTVDIYARFVPVSSVLVCAGGEKGDVNGSF